MSRLADLGSGFHIQDHDIYRGHYSLRDEDMLKSPANQSIYMLAIFGPLCNSIMGAFPPVRMIISNDLITSVILIRLI